MQQLFEAIKAGDTDLVRDLILENKDLTTQKLSDQATIKYDREVELDGYKFLGAYIGAVTALQYSLFLGKTDITKDIIERSANDDLDIPFGGGNTALHLATFLGEKDIVSLLLSRGANQKTSNTKGFTPVDVLDDPDMREIFAQGVPAEEA